MRMLYLALFLVIPATAWAQSTTMDQLLQIHVSIEENLAKQLDAANARIESLTKENTELKKQLDAQKPAAK